MNGAARIAEARDAAGRIVVIIGSGALRREKSHRQRDAEKASKVEQVFSHVGISPET